MPSISPTGRPAAGRTSWWARRTRRRWPGSTAGRTGPGHALALHGPRGSGKTHLACVWQALSGAVAVEPRRLGRDDVPSLLGESTALVIDDLDAAHADAADAKAFEEALLHLYNMVREQGGHILIAGREPPARWPVSLADLGSRLKSVPAVGLGRPDDMLIQGVLVKLFADRQLRVTPAAVQYLAQRMERSFEAAQDMVARIDAAALEERREITLPLIRKVLQRREANEQTNP